jgi:hypothetical protein
MQLNPTLRFGLLTSVKLSIAFTVANFVLYFLRKLDVVEGTMVEKNIFVVVISLALYYGISIVWGVLLMTIKSFMPRRKFSPYICVALFLLWGVILLLLMNSQDSYLDDYYSREYFHKKLLTPMIRMSGVGLLYFLIDVSGVVDKIISRRIER